MKIVKCKRCGKYIHEAKKCLFCGSSSGFEETGEVPIHGNAAADYARAEALVEGKKFDKALGLCDSAAEWAPRQAGIYWLRLLAKNRCSGAAELIRRGFSCEEDPDFCNALRFSSGGEHAAYEEIRNLMFGIRSCVIVEIMRREDGLRSASGIVELKSSMKEKTEEIKKKLFSLWSDLEAAEQNLYMRELDFALLAKEHRAGLERAAQEALSIKSEISGKAECTEEERYSLRARMDSIRRQSEDARIALEELKERRAQEKVLKELTVRRDELMQKIYSQLDELKNCEESMQLAISQQEKIRETHRKAILAAESYDFSEASGLLGVDVLEAFLRRNGAVKSSDAAEGSKVGEISDAAEGSKAGEISDAAEGSNAVESSDAADTNFI